MIQVGRIKADDSLPWGKVMEMVIEEPEHFDDLHRWIVFIAYDGFHDNWKIGDVISLLDDDRYLVAWYALWRKWPLQYEAWG